MHCPRCDDALVTYTLRTGEAAVVCERCGYADVSASHHGEVPSRESWDDALERLEEGEASLGRLKRVSQAVAAVDTPDDERTTIDGNRLEETGVSVGTTLRDDDSGANGDEDEAFRLVGGRADRAGNDTGPTPEVTDPGNGDRPNAAADDDSDDETTGPDAENADPADTAE